jgi:1,4-alpha-glucan branching enzyme
MPTVASVVRTPAPAAPEAARLPDGMLRVPAPTAQQVELRFAPLAERDRFDPGQWRRSALKPSFEQAGHYEIDLDALRLADGPYEYDYILDNRADNPVADPFAEEITRFGGYRGVFHIQNSRRVRPRFSWADELTPDRPLPENNRAVVYEMPLRWMDSAPEDRGIRQVDLGTFESVIFQRLGDLERLGVNAIELLPIQDSPDTLNWGYGTRFFFAPDLDMGTPVDLKFFVKQCHRRGIRVILDVVMNHASAKCPLRALAEDWFFLPPGSQEEGDRPSWGGYVFRYRTQREGQYQAREFHYRMAEFWVREYHVDGFRIDEFRGIDNWEFVQTFRERAWAEHRRLFPDRPFLVVAEDSWRRPVITQDDPNNPNGRQVVDAMWNFAYRDEARRLLRDGIWTNWGEPSRRERVEALVSGRRTWDDLPRRFQRGFADLSEAVNYITSHDVEHEGEQRYMNAVFAPLLRERGLGDGSVGNVRWLVDNIATQSEPVRNAHEEALERVRSAFALLLTSVGVPMLLAGEEFADVHDLNFGDYRLKMSDPVDWTRRGLPGHQTLWDDVRELITLRTTHGALERNEVEFFYFHPDMDGNGGARVFAYCRPGGQRLGSRGQVVVVVNAGPQRFTEFRLPWPWAEANLIREVGAPDRADAPTFYAHAAQASVPLAPFQVRVFTT